MRSSRGGNLISANGGTRSSQGGLMSASGAMRSSNIDRKKEVVQFYDSVLQLKEDMEHQVLRY